MPISIGCAIWSYPGWIGEVYPPKTPAKEFLHVYSNHFPAVEGNTTFYAIPDKVTIDRWRSQTPPKFKFCLKFPRAITHNGLLVPYLIQAQTFITQMQALGNKLGVMFIQLPPNYAPSEGFADLTAFLTALSRRDVSIALEVRHLDWFNSPHRERLNELLTKLGIGRVILDSRPIYEADKSGEVAIACKKPRVPIDLTLTAPFSLIRYVSHPVRSANQIWLDGWAKQVKIWLQQDTQVYMFVHCPIEVKSPINARYLHEVLGASGISLAPLPPPLSDDSPVQLNLF
ncbi:DUF72 domain-containing protein [Chamaesiphon sp. GL140_3_metabinner_50]|uniref:DUF72 domain-containing protein n=1 Tax=Chamaesiphon sp. GL140_3_metabinner_50 TaxID=2970812 RepID=UPI0025CE526A|nr:DUF72 domain-containing protein [Chamaesiphon sp. GL140_3_metabinner_50]